jgi:hypothetical protein
MDKVAALKQIALDPRLSLEERRAAEDALALLAVPDESPEAPSAAPLVEDLLQFAGAARLEDIPPAVIVEFVEASTADPEALAALGSDWHLMRCLQGYPVVEGTWNTIKRDYAEPERHAAFERLTQQYPFLGPNPITLRLWSEEIEYLRTLCEQNGEQTTRRYFIPRIQAFFDRLPEHAFDSRDAARSLLGKYQGENHDEHSRA